LVAATAPNSDPAADLSRLDSSSSPKLLVETQDEKFLYASMHDAPPPHTPPHDATPAHESS